MDILANVDLLFVGVAAAGTAVLGFSALLSGSSNVTNRTFFYFSIVTAAWGILNFLSYKFTSAEVTLWSLRAVLFLAVWQAYFILKLLLVFPYREYAPPQWYIWLLLTAAAIVSGIVLTPYTFSGIDRTIESIGNTIATPATGIGIVFFGLFNLSAVFGSIFVLLYKIRKAQGHERTTFQYVLLGTGLMFFLIISFNFILPAVYQNVSFIPLGALFILPYVLVMSYAILKRNLFNIKVAATAILVLVLSILTLLEVIFATSVESRIFRASVFTLVVVIGINLIKGVVREVEQRELIQAQAVELEQANRQQEGLLHFISHEVKGYLTKNEAAFAAINTGDFGEVSPKLQRMSGVALDDTRKGVETVMDILDASNLKRGTVAYNKHPFDIAHAVGEIVHDLTSAAEERGIALIYETPTHGDFTIEGDEDKIRRHVIRNIIDNSVKYTLKGSVHIALTRFGNALQIVVKDTGVGITSEDMKHLFTEGGKGAESVKVNVHSTGYGLFIAKQIVVGHGGRIWAESEGKDKGSRFIVELPATN